MNRRLQINEQQPASGVVIAADNDVMKIVAICHVKLFPECSENYPIDVNNVQSNGFGLPTVGESNS